MTRPLALCVALCALVFAVDRAQAQTPPQEFAIAGVTLWNGDANPVPNVRVVVRAGRIVSVTPGAPAQGSDADGRGLVLTPGFVAVQTELGLEEIELEPATVDSAPEGDDADPIRASFSAADGFNPESVLFPVARLGGITSALSTPQGGLVAGTSAWLDLAGSVPADMLARDVVALHVDVDDAGIASAGGARPAALGLLREVLEDARLYGRQRAQFDRNALRELHASRADLERLQDALAGRIPVVVHVSRAADILRVLELGRVYGLRLALSGAEDAWRVAPQLARADVPVIVRPMANLPSSFTTLGTRYDNAAILAAAGVRIVIATEGAHDVHNLRQEAANAIAEGLDRNTALRALTSEPARVFGLERDYGTVAPGKVANFVVWSGDPFEVSSRPVTVFVRGAAVTLRSRQTALFERYRALP